MNEEMNANEGAGSSPKSKSPNPEIAFFPSIWENKCKNVNLVPILKGHMTGKWQQPIEKLRGFSSEPDRYEKEKLKLPAFIVSAASNGGRKSQDMIDYNGLVQIDIDKVGARAQELRDALGKDPYVVAAWLSPGGNGVKGIFRTDSGPGDHKKAFKAVAAYIKEKYNAEMDSSCSHINRLCFVSYDPDIIFNPYTEVFRREEKSKEKKEKKVSTDPIITDSDSESSDSESESISISDPCNTPQPETSHERGQTAREFFAEWPKLEPYYKRHVSIGIGEPQRGQRNEAIVQLVSSLYGIIHVKFIAHFAAIFREENSAVFGDYPEGDYWKEVDCLLSGLEESYPNRLSLEFREIYWSLPNDADKSAFRICESLSKVEDKDAADSKFYLAVNELQKRLGICSDNASGILFRLRSAGVIELVEKGSVYTAGQKPKATTYRWLMKSRSEAA